jgi:hypothetical protein
VQQTQTAADRRAAVAREGVGGGGGVLPTSQLEDSFPSDVVLISHRLILGLRGVNLASLLRCVPLSPAHRAPNGWSLRSGDVLVIAGDIELRSQRDVALLERWLASLPHPHKVVGFG